MAATIFANSIELAVMADHTCSDPVESIWSQTEELAHEGRSALPEIVEMWAEISSMFENAAPQNGVPAPIVADYLVGSVQQHEYMDRTAKLLGIVSSINDRSDSKTATIRRLAEASKNIDWEYAATVFERDTALTFQSLRETVREYPCNLKRLWSSTIIVAYGPVFFIRDAFAVFLDKPHAGRVIFRLFSEITLDAAIGLIPFGGMVKSIAQAVHSVADGQYERFTQGLRHEVRMHQLRTAVGRGLELVDEAERVMEKLRAENVKLDNQFDQAAIKCTKVAEFLSKHQ